jgi:hypothetical protein
MRTPAQVSAGDTAHPDLVDEANTDYSINGACQSHGPTLERYNDAAHLAGQHQAHDSDGGANPNAQLSS